MPERDTALQGQEEPLLTGELLQKLDHLDVLSKKIFAGKLHGERRSKKKGQSVLFADYRPYAIGDDLRFIDWNLYARLDRLFLRLFVQEEDLSVSILLDTTASMDWGEPKKLMYAKRVAAALGYVGLVNYNRVHLYSFAQTIVDQITNLRGRRRVRQMLDFLRSQAPRQSGHFVEVCRRFALTQPNKGVVIIISDFLDKGDIAKAWRYLSGHIHDVYALQILAPQELNPENGPVSGDVRLFDCEDAEVTEVSIGPMLIRRYKKHVKAFCDRVRQQCLKRGIAHTVADTSVSVDALVLRQIRGKGLLG